MHFNIFIHHWLNPESQLHLNLPEATDCNVLAVLLKLVLHYNEKTNFKVLYLRPVESHVTLFE